MNARADLHEVPLPPPEKPERERERRPEYEHVAIAVGEASAWVADVQRNARDFAQRHGDVALSVELEDRRRLEVRELRSGPGAGFVTLTIGRETDERELSVRLDRIAGTELTRAGGGDSVFRVRGTGVGFGR